MSNKGFGEDITWRFVLVRAAIVVGTVALISWFMPRDSSSYYQAEEGRPWKYADLTAPFDFPIYKSDEMISREKDSLMEEYEPYYNYDSEIGGKQVSAFVSDFAEGIEGLTDDYISIIANRLRQLYETGIIDASDYSDLKNDSSSFIRIVKGKSAVSTLTANVYSTKTAYERLLQDEMLEPYKGILTKCDLNEYILPNLTYDEQRNEESINDLMSTVPLASGVVQKGQKIIDRGEIVSETAYRTIESYKREMERRSSNVTQMRLTIAGQTLYVGIFIIFFTMYLGLFRKDYFAKVRSMGMLYALILIFSIVTALLARGNLSAIYILPYAIVPIFARIFMDSRTAFMTHVTMVLVCACMMEEPFVFIVVEMACGLTAIYSLRELQFRSQLFKTACFVAGIGIITYFATDLIKASDMAEMDWDYYKYFIINGILLLFAYPLLYVVEKAFGFISDITLIELSNTNNSLLRRMSEVAPGTFQHSIQVGNLGAEIANRIGANAQLVRTGALYHDIGKMGNPIYFTENQSGASPHDNMSYIDSAQVIISHVTDGLKLADKHHLPTILRDFIATHHGQGKTKFFYIKYKNEHPDEDVDELLFTYPGPNPFTREQAILMMADSVEAASRSLPDYTEKTIRELVERIVDGMVTDGFFRECPITFRDLAYAKTVLVEKLKTMYHTRVRYPTLKETGQKDEGQGKEVLADGKEGPKEGKEETSKS